MIKLFAVIPSNSKKGSCEQKRRTVAAFKLLACVCHIFASMSGMFDLSIARWFKAWVERRRDDAQGDFRGKKAGFLSCRVRQAKVARCDSAMSQGAT